MNSMQDKAGIIRITDKTPGDEATLAIIRALFAYHKARKVNEFTEVVFRNRTIQPMVDTVVIVTHRTPGPMVKVQNAFRHVWAGMSANKQMRIRFEVDEIWEGEGE
jgi:hypothetical protein